MNVKTLLVKNTVYNADCIDFCPIDKYQHILAVGTYELKEVSENFEETDTKTNKRVGCLYLFSFQEEKLTTLQEIEMPGILDVRWCSHIIEERTLLALVNAEGMLIIYTLEEGTHLKKLAFVSIGKKLALYLDWSTRIIPNSVPLLSVSDSEGYITLFSLENSNITLLQTIKAHEYEAWVTCFNHWNPSVVYTGADDCYFKSFDIQTKKVIFSHKFHKAGVTSIQPSLLKEQIIYSGCYNGDLNSWDLRCMKHPVMTVYLGGGVWRLRSEPHHKPLMISSTMHEGFHIIKVDKTDKLTVIGNYAEHDSLAYGADWSWSSKNKTNVLGSVSFYDKLISLWEFEII